MNNNFKKYLVFMSFVFLFNILSACSSDDKNDILEDSPKNKALSKTGFDSTREGLSTFNENIEKKITINHRCTACGRCSLFDPEHFKDMGRRILPEIISQNSLESISLQKAIKACPANAIVFN